MLFDDVFLGDSIAIAEESLETTLKIGERCQVVKSEVSFFFLDIDELSTFVSRPHDPHLCQE